PPPTSGRPRSRQASLRAWPQSRFRSHRGSPRLLQPPAAVAGVVLEEHRRDALLHAELADEMLEGVGEALPFGGGHRLDDLQDPFLRGGGRSADGGDARLRQGEDEAAGVARVAVTGDEAGLDEAGDADRTRQW